MVGTCWTGDHAGPAGAALCTLGPALLAAEFPFADDQTQQVQCSAHPNPASQGTQEFAGTVPQGRLSPSALLCGALEVSLLAFFFSLTSLQVVFLLLQPSDPLPGPRGTCSVAHPKPEHPTASPGGDHHRGGYRPGDASWQEVQAAGLD